MRVTLDIQNGPAAGKRFTLGPGQKILVGRASWAELSVPDDTMSGRHFTLECDQFRCTLRDFKGSSGIRLNGGPIAEAVLRDGDRIVAGQSTFLVHVGENEPPPPARPDRPEPMASVRRVALLDLLRGRAQPLFAVLDTARDPRIRELLRDSKEPFEPLYDGEKGPIAQAPYLVRLMPESPLLPKLAAAWGKSWGFYLTCQRPIVEVRKHLQQFLKVETPDGKVVHFRFYDPRVFRAFLPACDRTEIGQVFGPIQTFFVEADGPNAALRFRFEKPQLRQVTLLLTPTGG